MELKENNKLIVKANCLIEASYRLSITEQKIMYMVISLINKNDVDFKNYEFKVIDFIKILGLKGKSAYNELKSVIRLLRSRTFTINYMDEDGKNKELITGWIINGEYVKNDGIIQINIDPKLKPFLLKLKKEFTSMNLNSLMQLKRSYSTRIYELLKQYLNIGERTFKIEQLKNVLAIEPHEYKLYSHLKSRVIKPAIDEINRKMDLFVKPYEIKESRKVVAIKFTIHSNTHNISKSEISMDIVKEDEKIKTVQTIIQEKITELEAKKILGAAVGDINKVKEKYLLVQNTDNINNIVAWIIKAIKEDWKPQKGKKKVNENNFKQREYDFKDLEKKLLGWND